jgi:hypothetical protein
MAQCNQDRSLAPARLSLLSDDQYRNIIHDVFGVTFPATQIVSVQTNPNGSYPFNEAATITQQEVLQSYLRAADAVASLLQSIPPCTSPSTLSATCMEQYLRSTLPRAWRRSLTDAEYAGLMNIFNMASTDGAAMQVQVTMEAALIHPAFLYRSELGTSTATMAVGSKVALTPYELASALSFAAYNSVPDPELLAKAQDGTITQASVLAAQVARLVALPSAKTNLTTKVSYYLNFEKLPLVSKDATTYPDFAAVKPALYQGAELLLNDVMAGGRFSDLFTSQRIYTNAAISALYGLPAVTGTQLQAVTPTGKAYTAGILTQPALLASTNPKPTGDDVIHRGLWVYYNLICAPPAPAPPANANSVAAMHANESTRQQAAFRDAPIPGVMGSGCGAGCHGRFDPFGLVTMSYDSIGRYRTTDPSTTPPNQPVDDTAQLPAGVLGPDPVMLTDAADLAQRLAQGRQASDCAARNIATYALEHSPEVEGSCALQIVKDQFQKSQSFVDMYVSLLTSPGFATRDIE